MPARPHDSTLVYSSEDPSARRVPDGDTPRRPERRRHVAAPPKRRGPTGGPPVKDDGIVRIWLERKGRNGKPVSILRGLALDGATLGALASRLKRVCGSGGSAKDGEIIIQGDHRARIARELEHDGYRVKLAGG